jgi:hypothetical protein
VWNIVYVMWKHCTDFSVESGVKNSNHCAWNVHFIVSGVFRATVGKTLILTWQLESQLGLVLGTSWWRQLVRCKCSVLSFSLYYLLYGGNRLNSHVSALPTVRMVCTLPPFHHVSSWRVASLSLSLSLCLCRKVKTVQLLLHTNTLHSDGLAGFGYWETYYLYFVKCFWYGEVKEDEMGADMSCPW